MTGRVSRRAFLGAAGAVTGALALPGLTSRAARAQGDKYGGLLRVSVTFGLSTINPVMHISGAEWTATKWMYNNLTRLNVKREVVPDLAASWSAADGARVWTFKLRPGVKFHSGRELVADDVVATFTTLLDAKTASPYRGEVGPIDKVEAVDKHTVRFTMRAPFSIFPETVSVPNARIVAREGLGDLKALAAREFGTGPFKLKEFVPGDRLVVERFGDYFRKGQPYLDGAMLRVFPEPTTELTAFKSKEVDLTDHVALPPRAADVTRARALLRDAGLGSGVPFKLFAANSPPIRERVAVVLKEMARPAGFNIDVEVLAYDRYLAQVWNKGVPYVVYYGTRPTADAILMKLYHPKEGLDEGRWAPSHAPAIRLLEQARETVESERRRRLYADFLKISRDEGPLMLPFFVNELSGKWGFVRDYQINPASFDMVLDDVWLAPDAPKKKA